MATKVTFSGFKAGSSAGDVTAPSGGPWALVSAGPIEDQGQPTIAAVWTDSPAAGDIARETRDVALGVTANATADFYLPAVAGGKVASIDLFTVGVPASALGTILLTITKNGSSNVLAAANFDLESLTTLTLEALALTATSANLELDPGDYLRFRVVSNNADATGTSGLRAIVRLDNS